MLFDWIHQINENALNLVLVANQVPSGVIEASASPPSILSHKASPTHTSPFQIPVVCVGSQAKPKGDSVSTKWAWALDQTSSLGSIARYGPILLVLPYGFYVLKNGSRIVFCNVYCSS